MKKLAMLGIALIAGTALVATAQTMSKGTIKIASQTPLSGGQANLGEAIKNGAQIAIEELADATAIRRAGFTLVFQPEDDQATAAIGVSNAKRLVSDADILGIVGHLNSGVALPSSQVYKDYDLAMISPANTNEKITDEESTRKINNRVCGRDDIQGPAAADFVTNTLKAKRVYVVNNKTPYGEGIAKNFANRVKANGAAIAFEVGVNESDTDFSSVINRAKAEKPDAIFFGAIYNQAALLIKQMRDQGIMIPVVGGDGFDSADLQKIAGAANMKKVYFSTTAAPISVLPAAKTFAAKYKTKFGKDPEGYSAYGYDAARAMLSAINSAIKANKGAKPTRLQVAEAVRKVSFTGLTGKIAFNSRGDLKQADYFIVEAAAEYANNKVSKKVTVKAPVE
jgi:branched-chain amino acid transport system substrate-binding protein